jgi:hypothetical protein
MSEVNVPKFPEFRELRIEDREILQACLDRLPPETADQNFTSLFMWRHNYNVKISRLNGCVCLHCTALEGEFFFPPVGKRMLESAETCLAFLREQAKEPIIGRASESLVKRCFADRGSGQFRIRLPDGTPDHTGRPEVSRSEESHQEIQAHVSSFLPGTHRP